MAKIDCADEGAQALKRLGIKNVKVYSICEPYCVDGRVYREFQVIVSPVEFTPLVEWALNLIDGLDQQVNAGIHVELAVSTSGHLEVSLAEADEIINWERWKVKPLQIHLEYDSECAEGNLFYYNEKKRIDNVLVVLCNTLVENITELAKLQMWLDEDEDPEKE